MAAIVHIETIVPEFRYKQSEIAAKMENLIKDRKALQYTKSLYADSGIENRYSCLADYQPDSDLIPNTDKHGKNLLTGARNKIFAEESRKLVAKLAKNTFSSYQSLQPADITHLITVSCTGFYNPGPDMQLISEFGIPKSVERYHLGFMGCYAALPALRMANSICNSDNKAKVLILCLELCTLHFQSDENLDVLLANSIFADGAAMVLVQNDCNQSHASIEIESFQSQIIPEAEKDMAWTIGDYGFEMVLSRYIPKVISANIMQLVNPILKNLSLQMQDIGLWAVHPGGKSILDKVEESLELLPAKLQSSRQTLRDFGNMSSATILFVLKDILLNTNSTQKIFALAFGPGLVIESALLNYNPGK